MNVQTYLEAEYAAQHQREQHQWQQHVQEQKQQQTHQLQQLQQQLQQLQMQSQQLQQQMAMQDQLQRQLQGQLPEQYPAAAIPAMQPTISAADLHGLSGGVMPSAAPTTSLRQSAPHSGMPIAMTAAPAAMGSAPVLSVSEFAPLKVRSKKKGCC
jgi:TolA-binding protein